MPELSAAGPRRMPPVEDRRQGQPLPMVDGPLAFSVLALVALGLVMVASASISWGDHLHQQPLYYFWRQLLHLGVGLALAAVALRLSLAQWQRLAPWALVAGALLLALLLLPGVGQTVNGSTRWLSLGVANFQPAEVAKLALILYLADYLVRRADRLQQRWGAFLAVGLVLALYAGLLLAQPDYGSTVVLAVVTLVLLFLGGVPLGRFLLMALLGVGALAALAVISPYRMARLTSFLDPWADPFGEGFQLSQALIALGRGEWLGAGLGGSVQKLFYLPEAHTDFVFAVIGEELGLVGVLTVIALYGLFLWRCFRIARRAEEAGRAFGAYLVYGVAVWIGFQAFVNMGVNLGILPTKGLTLPLISYGGSSLIVTCVAIALVLRVDLECRYPYRFGGQERRLRS